MVYNKFVKEFNEEAANIGLKENENINLIQTTTLFQKLGFITDNDEQNLSSLIKCIIPITNLKHVLAIMCCIQNFNLDWYNKDSNSDVNTAKMGEMVDGNIFFTQNEIAHLTKKFLILYKNRQNYYQQRLKDQRFLESEKKGKLGEVFLH